MRVGAQAPRQVVRRVFSTTGDLRVPQWVRLLMRLPGIRILGPRLIGIGVRAAHVAPDLRMAQRPRGAVTSRSA